jgi:hypothetical protein
LALGPTLAACGAVPGDALNGVGVLLCCRVELTVMSGYRQQRGMPIPSVARMKVMTRPLSSPADSAGLTTFSVCVLTATAAVATSTSYVLQPELPAVARDVGSTVPVIGVVAALPVGGYLFGLALLVPLADRMRSHRLISGQLGVLATGLLLAAAAATPLMLGVGLFVDRTNSSRE